jgi:F0F1-type ATP synthase assembly protein I
MPYNRPIPESKKRSKVSMGIASWVQAEKLMQIALVLPSAVLIGWAGGAWLDSRFHQKWIAVVGIILGSIAGLTSAIRLAMDVERSASKEDESREESGKGSVEQKP